jgi:hypothetical protein
MSSKLASIENGFIKAAAASGVDEAFISGYLKYASDVVEVWKEVIKLAEKKSGDPKYRQKLAYEIMAGHAVVKIAEPGAAGEMSGEPGFLSQLGGLLGGDQQTGAGALGGGGGGLLGLLLGQMLFPDNPWLGLLLAGLGTGAGYFGGRALVPSAPKAPASPDGLRTQMEGAMQQRDQQNATAEATPPPVVQPGGSVTPAPVAATQGIVGKPAPAQPLQTTTQTSSTVNPNGPGNPPPAPAPAPAPNPQAKIPNNQPKLPGGVDLKPSGGI